MDSDKESSSSLPAEGDIPSTGATNEQTENSRDSEKDSQTAAKTSSVSVDSSIRERRKTKLSSNGKESKVSELCLNIGKRINVEFRFLTETQKTVSSSGITLSDLYDTYDTVDNRMKCIIKLYDELVALCDDNTNKIPEQTNQMYALFVSRATEFCSSMEKQMDEQEAVEQEILKNMKN